MSGQTTSASLHTPTRRAATLDWNQKYAGLSFCTQVQCTHEHTKPLTELPGPAGDLYFGLCGQCAHRERLFAEKHNLCSEPVLTGLNAFRHPRSALRGVAPCNHVGVAKLMYGKRQYYGGRSPLIHKLASVRCDLTVNEVPNVPRSLVLGIQREQLGLRLGFKISELVVDQSANQ